MKWVGFVVIFVLLQVMTGASVLDAQKLPSENPESVALTGPEEQVENLRAFAKLYGHVRYFHPSDEAKAVDWLKFAVHGAAEVKDATDDADLVRRLSALFSPLAPTLQFYSAGDPPPSVPFAGQKGAVRAWQHLGLGTGPGSIYRSFRLGDVPQRLTNEIWLELRNQPFKGKHFKLSARAKATMQGGLGASVYLFARNAQRQTFFEDLMRDRLITDDEWRTYEISGTFEDETAYIEFGAELLGNGQAFFDDFAFSISEDGKSWQPVALDNMNFDQAEEDGSPTGWRFHDNQLLSYRVTAGDQDSLLQDSMLHVESIADHTAGQLFSRYPKLGEFVDEKIAGDLRYRMPLALPLDQPLETNKPFEALQKTLAGLDTSVVDNSDENKRLANVIHTWNALQHFYPYFEWASADWDETLTVTIADALDDRSEMDFYRTMRRMVAKLEDGHGEAFFESLPDRGGLPISASWIEDTVVITASESDLFQPGDIVSTIDGKSGEASLLEAERYTSGSPQLRRFRALNQFGQGDLASIAELELIRAGSTVKVSYPREAEKRGFFHNKISPFDLPDIEEIEEGIYYVNRQTVSKADYRAHLDKLATAKAIIFDSRWDGKSTQSDGINPIRDIIAHLIEAPVTSANWLIPEVIYPDQASLTFAHSTWDVQPAEPHFQGKAVFINSPPVVSYGETVMGFVSHYGLGTMVGGPTAGCNGNVNTIHLIGGDTVWFTGMKVLNQDESRLHLIGFQPDNPVARTVAGVAAGRDEYLEEALRVARQ